MQKKCPLSAMDALARLQEGALARRAAVSPEDAAAAVRRLAVEGQEPYAVIVTCSDSRVIPEAIFGAGPGELFVIRVAGNVMDDHQLGSIEYAATHLGCRLVVVLGHTHCGAVEAAVHHDPGGYIKFITDEIRQAIGLAIGEEKDVETACVLNVRRSVAVIEESLDIQREEENGLLVLGAVYHLEDGSVEFLPR